MAGLSQATEWKPRQSFLSSISLRMLVRNHQVTHKHQLNHKWMEAFVLGVVVSLDLHRDFELLHRGDVVDSYSVVLCNVMLL